MKEAKTHKRIGSMTGVMALRCCDLGEAVLETGEIVTTTWGLNLSEKDSVWYKKTGYEPMLTPHGPYYELIFPEKEAKVLRSILLKI